MKTTFIFLLIITAPIAHAQSKVSVMLQQIAAYQGYLQNLKKGYDLTQKGLTDATGLKNGTFELHQQYFNSLSAVSPAVKNNKKVQSTLDLETAIETIFQQTIYKQQTLNVLSAVEQQYLNTVYQNVLKDCQTDLEQLSMVVTEGKSQLSDDARIKEVDRLYGSMQQKYVFARSFTALAAQIAEEKQQQRSAINTLQQLYNLK